MGGLLLDTNVALWWLAGDVDELGAALIARLRSDLDVHLSPVVVWEVAIKLSSGNLNVWPDAPERLRDAGWRELEITAEHGIRAGRLPLLHRDPFDRMLVAQAQAEGLTIATRDRDIARYDVDVLAV